MQQKIHIQAQCRAPLNEVWEKYNDPAHIQAWNAATEDWHCPAAENNLVEGGQFSYTMAAKDGSFQFDFKGTYDHISPNRKLKYTLDDGRKVTVDFQPINDAVKIDLVFEPESNNDEDMQRAGWQAILDNFVAYCES